MKVKFLSLFLIFFICFAQCSFPERVDADVYLSDEMADEIVKLLYMTSDLTASKVKNILTGKEQGTKDQIASICKTASNYYKVLNQSELIEEMAGKTTADYAGNIGFVLNFVTGAFSAQQNMESFLKTDSELQKYIDAIQIGLNALSMMGLGSYVPTAFSAAISVIELGVGVIGLIQQGLFKENLAFYKNDLAMAYALGEELPSWEERVPSIVELPLGVTQKQADAAFALAYFDYCVRSINDNINTPSVPENPTSFKITYDSNCDFLEDYSYTYYVNEPNWHVPTMSRAGYVFDGWYWDRECTNYAGGNIAVDKNLTFYAKWIQLYEYTTIEGGIAITKLLNYEYENGIIKFDIVIPEKIDGYEVKSIGEWAFHQSEITGITMPDTIETIQKSAFYECKNLTKIMFSKNIKKINEYAFGYCSSLTKVTLPEELTSLEQYTFGKCSSLKEIDFGTKIVSFGNYAFWDCEALETIILPNSLQVLSTGVFWECSSLKNVIFGTGLVSINDLCFYGTALEECIIPDSVTYVGNQVFQNCTSLKKIVFGKNVLSTGNDPIMDSNLVEEIVFTGENTIIEANAFLSKNSLKKVEIYGGEIGNNAFGNCSSLEEIILGDSVKSIGEYAFSGCSSLTDITLPENITSIKPCTFWNCTSLKEINLGNKIKNIDNYAFWDCTSLETITLPNSLQVLSKGVFWNCNSLKNVIFGTGIVSINDLCFYGTALEECIIPDSVTYVGNQVFQNCTSLKKIVFGKNVLSTGNDPIMDSNLVEEIVFTGENTIIEANAFSAKKNLKKVEIYGGEIGNNSFANCTALEDVVFGDSIKKIGKQAFMSCHMLTTVELPESIEKVDENAFGLCTSLREIYVGGGEICDYAFSGCKLLQNIKFGEVYEVGELAFNNCPNIVSVDLGMLYCYSFRQIFGKSKLEQITVSEANPFISVDDNVLFDKEKKVLLYYPANKYDSDGIYEIPEGVERVEDYAFCDAYKKINKIIFPESLLEIGVSSFHGLENITEINLPENLVYVGDYAFYGCLMLNEINISDSVEKIGAFAFQYCGANIDTTLKLNLGDGVNKVDEYAFADIYQLEELIIPDSMLSLGNGVFSNCIKLEKVNIGNKLEFISERTFAGCKSLAEVKMPKSIVEIGESAFSSSGIQKIYYEGAKGQWDEISVADNNIGLDSARIYYNYKGHIVTDEYDELGRKEITVSLVNAEEGKVIIIAGYDNNGRLVYVDNTNCAPNEKISFIVKKSIPVRKIKVFAWNSLGGQEAYIETETLAVETDNTNWAEIEPAVVCDVGTEIIDNKKTMSITLLNHNGDEVKYYIGDDTIGDLSAVTIGDILRINADSDGMIKEFKIVTTFDKMLEGEESIAGAWTEGENKDRDYAQYRHVIGTATEVSGSVVFLTKAFVEEIETDSVKEYTLDRTTEEMITTDSAKVVLVDSAKLAQGRGIVTVSKVDNIVGFDSKPENASKIFVYMAEGDIKLIVIFK